MGCGASAEGGDLPIPFTFPKGVEVSRRLYVNWDQTTLANNVLTCTPKNENELLAAVNWAMLSGWTVRPVGIKHNWSPITIVSQGADKNLDGVLLVSLMEHMNKVEVIPAADGKPPMAKVQLGCNQADFLTALEKAPGGTDTIGYGLPHTPAPDSITIGGLLAIDGHGTAVACESESAFLDPKTTSYGTYSNRMLACRAVVYDEAKHVYMVKEFRREDGDAIAPFLAHVGRAFLTEATLKVEPNYYMRCQSHMQISWQDMFPAPVAGQEPPEKSMAWYVKHCGRAEAIWFPFTDNPWLKVWTVTGAEKPEGSRRVDHVCNYPFSDDLGENITKFYRSFVGADDDKKDHLIKSILDEEHARLGAHDNVKSKHFGEHLIKWFKDVSAEVVDAPIEAIGGPRMTPVVNKLVWLRCATGLVTTDSDDIWGPSKNTLIYVRDSTLRVTANGYAVMTRRENVQLCMHVFVQLYKRLLDKFQAEGKYPIACPLEIRVTGLDDPATLGIPNAVTPPLSALCYDEVARENKWDVALWLDVLSLPGTQHSNEFYTEMEAEMMKHEAFNGAQGRIRPEWSKGWGYTHDGPWRAEEFRRAARERLPQWDETMQQLDAHDAKGLFSNAWMKDFFVPLNKANDNKAAAPTQLVMLKAPDPVPNKYH